MLFTADVLDGVRDGSVTCAFRRWKRPTVKAGGTLVTAAGVLDIESVDVIGDDEITAADARRAGAADIEAVLAGLPPAQEDRALHRIRFHLAGEDPRLALREQAVASDAERELLLGALHRLDRASRSGPWTRQVLALIDANPGVRAGDLAAVVGEEREIFKRRVRRLKALGLTESLGTGYRTTPRYRSIEAPTD